MNDDEQPIRVITRALADFMFRAVQAVARLHDGDLLAAVVFATVKNANLSFAARSVSEAREPFSVLDELTDKQLRPVSVNAIAKSFGIPYETARAAAARLIKRGFCVRMPGGLIVPVEVMLRQDVLIMKRDISLILDETLDHLSTIGFDFDQIAATAGAGDAIGASPPPTRQAAWIAMDFLLRLVEVVSPIIGDFTDCFIFVAVLAANTRGISVNPQQAWAYASMDKPLPDDARTPIRVRHLADLLDVPFETTRRHVNRMVETKLLARVEDGVIVPTLALERESFRGLAPVIAVWFMRMIAELMRAGYVFSPPKTRLQNIQAGADKASRRVGLG